MESKRHCAHLERLEICVKGGDQYKTIERPAKEDDPPRTGGALLRRNRYDRKKKNGRENGEHGGKGNGIHEHEAPRRRSNEGKEENREAALKRRPSLPAGQRGSGRFAATLAQKKALPGLFTKKLLKKKGRAT